MSALPSARRSAPAPRPAPAREAAAGVLAWRAMAQACLHLQDADPGRHPLERALRGLVEASGGPAGALYLERDGRLALEARVGDARRLELPARWESTDHAPTLLVQALGGAGRVAGLLAIRRPALATADFEAALRESAPALGEALSRRREFARLRALCPRDTLTGALTAAHFAERLEEETERARRYGVALGLVLLDVDRMAAINARHGQEAGDAVLGLLAARLQGQARRSDAVGRSGGDELAWLLPEADAAATAACGERARAALVAPALPRVGRVSVSVGVASLPRLAADARELREAAERSLTLAKKAGRNRVGDVPAVAMH